MVPIRSLALGAALTTFAVMVAGSYVSASGEGLSCPPGVLQDCPPGAEMLHRLLVGALGLLVLGMFILAARNRKRERKLFGMCAGALVLLFAQALLGQATIAVKLNPAVVASHQALALALFALLLHIAFLTAPARDTTAGAGHKTWTGRPRTRQSLAFFTFRKSIIAFGGGFARFARSGRVLRGRRKES